VTLARAYERWNGGHSEFRRMVREEDEEEVGVIAKRDYPVD
jgi:hypothetical protein